MNVREQQYESQRMSCIAALWRAFTRLITKFRVYFFKKKEPQNREMEAMSIAIDEEREGNPCKYLTSQFLLLKQEFQKTIWGKLCNQYHIFNNTLMLESAESVAASGRLQIPIAIALNQFTTVLLNGLRFTGFVLDIQVHPLVATNMLFFQEEMKLGLDAKKEEQIISASSCSMLDNKAKFSPVEVVEASPLCKVASIAPSIVNSKEQETNPFFSMLSNAWGTLKNTLNSQEKYLLEIQISKLENQCRGLTGRYDIVPTAALKQTEELLKLKHRYKTLTGAWPRPPQT